MTRLKVALRGQPLMLNPALNKGSAFSRREREDFGLVGMLPLQSNSLEEQQARAYEQYQSHKSDLAKNTFLQSLKGEYSGENLLSY
jgi:malate dehydrogenase (oxaloacetate-decarboxylating)